MMKTLTLLSLLLWSSLSSADQSLKRTYRITVPSACPYFCLQDKKKGYVVDILNLFFKEYEVPITFDQTPYARIYDSLMKRTSDLAVFTSLDLRNDNSFTVYESVLGLSFAGIISKKGSSTEMLDYLDLKGKALFVAQGSKAASKIISELSSINTDNNLVQLVTGSNIHERLINLVAIGRADYAIADYNSLINYYSKSKHKEKLKLSSISLSGYSPLRLVSAKGIPIHPIIQKNLQPFLDQIRNSGALEKILNKYDLTDWNLLLSR